MSELVQLRGKIYFTKYTMCTGETVVCLFSSLTCAGFCPAAGHGERVLVRGRRLRASCRATLILRKEETGCPPHLLWKVL